METRGRHAIADIWFKEYCQGVVVAAIERMLKKYTVLQTVKQPFVPQGLTQVWILGESHCTLHTYPEHNYISVDLYTYTDKYDPLDDLTALVSTLPYVDLVRGEGFDRGVL